MRKINLIKKDELIQFMKVLTYILVPITISCSNKEPVSQNNSQVSDSCFSMVTISSLDSTNYTNISLVNINYSIESFNYENSFRKFVCKTTTTERGNHLGTNQFLMKKEFLDYELNKIFEIGASTNRKIELGSRYYITRDLVNDLPDFFELNDYKTGKAFIKCTGLLWTVEIPNTNTKAYFGYRRSYATHKDTTKTIGIVYYSVNQEKNYKFFIKAKTEELFKSIYPMIGIKLKPKNPKDKFSSYSTLKLWSKDKRDDKKNITDFDLVLSVSFNLSDNSWKNNDSKKYIIPIKDGFIYGQDVADGEYELVIE